MWWYKGLLLNHWPPFSAQFGRKQSLKERIKVYLWREINEKNSLHCKITLRIFRYILKKAKFQPEKMSIVRFYLIQFIKDGSILVTIKVHHYTVSVFQHMFTTWCKQILKCVRVTPAWDYNFFSLTTCCM